MFKHILVAIDGSERSDPAIVTAQTLARSCGAAVTALLVVPDLRSFEFVASGTADRQPLEELRKSMLECGRERLAQALGRHGDAPHIDAQVIIGDTPYETIVERSAQLKCDLIVMASHGRGAVPSALLGSQTVRVIAGAAVPVLVVK